jgi:hypothetical protein
VGRNDAGELTVTRRWVAAGFLLLATACSSSASTPEAEPQPTTTPAPPAVAVSGPVHGGVGQATAAVQDLASLGYAESEYFFGGIATTYVGEHHADGVWDAHEDTTADFLSRMIVRRPQDPAMFSGTVVLEWLNVTTGTDGDPSWGYGAAEIMREGHAWVGVSAQPSGVEALATSDPARYGSLNHPGINYSYDVFTHAARALTNHSGTAPLGDLKPTTLIATGLSASVGFLIAYLNGVQPLVEMFDGFLMHAPAQPAPIRTDRPEPTLVFVTETDLTHFGWAHIRPPDSETVRTWEVAGAAHADAWLLDQDNSGYAASCPGRLNEGPHHQTLRAALHHLVAWVETGEAPPVAPRIDLATENPPVIARDEHGNARGGVRTPLVDVPVSALSGEPAPGGPPFCASFGSTIPFDAATLAQLYPDHAAYVDAFTASTEEAVDAGFILRPEADEMIAIAEQSAIRTGAG